MSKKNRFATITLTALIATSGAVSVASASASPTNGTATLASAWSECTWHDNTNIRSGPGTGYGIIRSYGPGVRLVLDRTQDGWSKSTQAMIPWAHLAGGGWVRWDLLTPCD